MYNTYFHLATYVRLSGIRMQWSSPCALLVVVNFETRGERAAKPLVHVYGPYVCGPYTWSQGASRRGATLWLKYMSFSRRTVGVVVLTHRRICCMFDSCARVVIALLCIRLTRLPMYTRLVHTVRMYDPLMYAVQAPNCLHGYVLAGGDCLHVYRCSQLNLLSCHTRALDTAGARGIYTLCPMPCKEFAVSNGALLLNPWEGLGRATACNSYYGAMLSRQF